ncbi:hypothetical protein CKO28_01625 [Rhodovibrio sodomensis]|uniref:Surface antigen domain-containing protein n=1 Tax=Rhodovibrio sodomensis TaxID=1088 RepID=A0ABS1D8J7_9PROT|nr:RT0821/Lpp0805 family surface protein [Rhodovibrio sodomensis]MBK1666744.1 hypothetical protein [Rhodovibrio sodomensis]
MKVLKIAGALALGAMLAACQTNGMGTKQIGGGLIGAGVGGLAGSQIGDGRGQLLATGTGAVIGLLVGSEIGKSLDRADKLYAERTAQQALETNPSGQPARWRNPDSGNRGQITPTRTYKQSGSYCREYQTTIMVGGKAQTGYGTACRMPDGSWQMQ